MSQAALKSSTLRAKTCARRAPLSPLHDPLIETAAEIKRLQDRFNTLDSLPQATGAEKNYRDAEKDDLAERIDILRDYLSVVPATSFGGAVAQLREVHLILDQIYACTNFPDSSKKFRRLLFSIDGVLGKMLPRELARRMDEMGSHMSPWTPYEGRVASISSSQEGV